MPRPRAQNLRLMFGVLLATAALAVVLPADAASPAEPGPALRKSSAVEKTAPAQPAPTPQATPAPETPAPAAVVAATVSPQPAGPAMWRVSDGDSRIYLLGTIHALPKGVSWTTPAYKAAMADAEVTVFECDIESRFARTSMASLVYERGANPSWQKLSDILGKERFERLVAVADIYGISTRSLERMRPWMAALQVSAAALRDAGYQGSLGVEKVVLADAKAEGDKLAMLETVEGQVKAFESLDGPEMIKNFDASISEIINMKRQIEPLLEAWQKGDLAALERLSSVEMRKSAPQAYKVLLVNRNRAWIDSIEHWLARKQKDYFVAVGAAHLVGPDSVIAMLEKNGHKVERIQ